MQGSWLGQWPGEWFGNGEEAPAGELAGAASVSLTAQGSLSLLVALEGSASFGLSAAEAAPQQEEDTGGIVAPQPTRIPPRFLVEPQRRPKRSPEVVARELVESVAEAQGTQGTTAIAAHVVAQVASIDAQAVQAEQAAQAAIAKAKANRNRAKMLAAVAMLA